MNTMELKKLEERVQEAKNLYACIETANQNIDGWRALQKKHEIVIISSDCEIFKKMREDITFDSTENIAPKYIAGNRKDRVIESLIKDQVDSIEKCRTKLKEL